jgi:hypothetical protein
VRERCVGGVCKQGEATNCMAVADACNVGVCDEAADECKRAPAREGMSCDDGSFCTATDSCRAGQCKGSGTTECPSTPCHIGVCDEEANACKQKPGKDGEMCDDGNPCTREATCSEGVCRGVLCENECAPGFDCRMDCAQAATCYNTCKESGSCEIDCAGSASCGLACHSTGCTLDCRGAAQCGAKCEGSASCTIDCRDAASCTEVICKPGANCTLLCAGSPSCSFKECKDPLHCADGSIACGRDCLLAP